MDLLHGRRRRRHRGMNSAASRLWTGLRLACELVTNPVDNERDTLTAVVLGNVSGSSWVMSRVSHSQWLSKGASAVGLQGHKINVRRTVEAIFNHRVQGSPLSASDYPSTPPCRHHSIQD
ncbi:hypothetical protein M758_4G051200 [Ceratodon purpureus]|nr:hypothetical protein M758_4G051200 [Ceratodon purpureus]